MTAGAGGPAGTALPGHNADVAALFDESADLLQREEANPFRMRTYHNAARVVRDLNRDVTGLGAAGEDLTESPGVGEHLAVKIREIVTTGRCALLSELHKHTPPALPKWLAIPGLDPKRVQAFAIGTSGRSSNWPAPSARGGFTSSPASARRASNTSCRPSRVGHP